MRTLLRLAGFRAALAYTTLLLVAMALVLGLLYARLADNLQASQDNLIWREAASLSLIHQRDGMRALAQTIEAMGRWQGSYLRLSDGLGAFIAGNLKTFPVPEATDAEGWLRFRDGEVPVRARLLQLDENLVLLVGHDVADGAALLARFRQAFALALIAMLFIGLGGGAFLARRGLKRVHDIGAALQPVMQGDLSVRLKNAQNDGQGGAEWQALEAQINAMLARLEKLMHATRQVSDNLAHDLRAPLTRLRARLEALLAKGDRGADNEIGAALEDVDGLLRSFNALLTLSRLESGVATLQAWPVELAPLMAELHDLFAPVFENKKMTLRIEGGDDLQLKGDAALLGQALVNLIENALAHAAVAGSEVVLAAQKNGAGVVVSLADSGGGIAPQDHEKALQRFARLDESRAGDGNGLGLSLVAAICAHHGGTLVLADNQPGLRAEMHLPATV